MTTVRFSQVVAQSGRPEPYTLWLDPKDDATFQKALRQDRIMSVQQMSGGTKTDYGEIGYTGARGELLIFPNSLKSFAGQRVVGVKYELLQEAPAAAPAKTSVSKPTRASAMTPRAQPRAMAENIVAFVKPPTPEVEAPVPAKEKGPRIVMHPPAREALKKKAPERKKRSAKPQRHHEPASAGSKQTAPAEPRKPSVASPPADPLLLLRRAREELRAGQAVQAYETLGALEKLLQRKEGG